MNICTYVKNKTQKQSTRLQPTATTMTANPWLWLYRLPVQLSIQHEGGKNEAK